MFCECMMNKNKEVDELFPPVMNEETRWNKIK